MMTIKNLLAQKRLIAYPCAYDALSALMIEKAGFDLIYASGLGVAAASLGVPDIGLITAKDVIQTALAITRVVTIPVIVDADTGYGDVKNVWWTVRQLEAGGVSGVQIEDQTLVKRCGYLSGKEVIPAEEYVKKLRAALDARRNRDFVIVARTDAADVYGLDEAIRRLNLYADNGADLAMSASSHTFVDYNRLAKDVKIPIVAVAPADPSATTVKQWEETGVRMVGYFGLPLFISMRANMKALHMFKTEGTVAKIKDEFFTYDEYAEIVKLPRWLEQAEKY
jgi:methylisocitrate lyase